MEEKQHKEKSKAIKGEVDNIRDFPEETLCASCGKFVGAYEKCPYCGAQLKKRMALAIFKRGCLIMSVVGLIALWYAAVKMEPVLITIGEIGPTYNKGIFRVKGTVTKMKFKPDKFFEVEMFVDDGTSDKALKVQSGDLEKMEKLDKLPSLGDDIEAIGEISLSAQWGTSMTLKAIDRMKITKKEVVTATIGEIDEEDVGNIYAVYGEVVKVREIPIGIAAVIGDETGTIELTLFTALVEQLGGADAVKPGEEIDLVALVSTYRDELQLKPRSPEEVTLTGEDRIATAKIPVEKAKKKKELPITKIGDLSPKLEGDTFSVRGKIINVREFGKGTGVTLKDDTGSIDVTLWKSTFDDYPDRASAFKVGGELIVQGKLGIYRDDIQLTPKSKDQVEVVGKKAPPKKKEAKPAKPKEKKKAEVPKPTPTKPAPKPTATKPPAPKPTPTKPPEAEKKPTAKPEAAETDAGKKPEAAAKPEAKAEAPKKPPITFAPMKIGDITKEKKGQFAEITGEVAGSNEFSKGLKLQVKDDSGTIDVVLWSDLLEKLTDKDTLTKEGARLSVKGRIGSYRDEMQLSPKYPNQIKLVD